MIPRKYADGGIILARKNYGEADRILVVYSKKFGKLHLIAKGVRKTKSKKRGHIEVFSHIKFSASRAKSLDLITEVETINSFEKVRVDLRKIALAYYFMEVIGRLTKEEEPNEQIFELILGYLKRTEKGKSLKKLKNSFIFESLVLLGFWPAEKKLANPDRVLEETMEKKVSSFRVGSKLLK